MVTLLKSYEGIAASPFCLRNELQCANFRSRLALFLALAVDKRGNLALTLGERWYFLFY